MTSRDSLVYTTDSCIGCNKCISACPAMGACMSVQDKNDTDKQHIAVNGTYGY